LNNLVNDIRANIGFAPNCFFRFAWTILCPLIVTLLMFLSFSDSDELKYGEYVFPSWSIRLGWSMNMAFILPVPLAMIYAFVRHSDTKRSIGERVRVLFVAHANDQPNNADDELYSSLSLPLEHV
jgi:hypothetical protein